MGNLLGFFVSSFLGLNENYGLVTSAECDTVFVPLSVCHSDPKSRFLSSAHLSVFDLATRLLTFGSSLSTVVVPSSFPCTVAL